MIQGDDGVPASVPQPMSNPIIEECVLRELPALSLIHHSTHAAMPCPVAMSRPVIVRKFIVVHKDVVSIVL